MSGSAPSALEVLCFKGGASGSATVHTERDHRPQLEGAGSEVQSCLVLHWFTAQPGAELKIPAFQSYLLKTLFFLPNWGKQFISPLVAKIEGLLEHFLKL